MFDDLVFEARTEAAAVRKACQKLMVEPRMLRYEVLAERLESKRRLNHLAPFCRIHVVDVVWPSDYVDPDVVAAPPTSVEPSARVQTPARDNRAVTTAGSPPPAPHRESSTARPTRTERAYTVPDKPIGDLVHEFLTGLLHRMGFDAPIRIEDVGHSIRCSIEPVYEPMKSWYGEGHVLESIGYLTNRYVGRFEGNKPVFVNLDDRAEHRDEALLALAKRMGEKARKLGKVVRIYPMNATDRKTIHTAIAELDGVRSESEGSGAFRRLLIIPTSSDAPTH